MPSSRRRVDGVEVDAAIQDERAVNLISTQVRPYISEEDCNPGMEVIEDPANDGLKCQASKRVFKIDQNGCDGNPACEANCVATCEEDPTCKAMIVQTNSCSGFNSVLDKTANAGSKAYKKVTACVKIKILRRVRAESSSRALRHRRHASMAWPCASSSPLDGASTAASSPRNDFVKNYRFTRLTV